MSDLVGQRFGRWLVIQRAYVKRKGTYWLCRCDCGTERAVREQNLLKGGTKSCGCYKRDLFLGRVTHHGCDNKPEFSVWEGMYARCCNKHHTAYKYYGGRGVTICDSWLNDPNVFIQWLRDKGWKKGLQVDRINTDKGYSPENCRLVTPQINLYNKRNNFSVGTWKCLAELLQVLKVCDTGLKEGKKKYQRIHYFLKAHGSLSDNIGKNIQY